MKKIFIAVLIFVLSLNFSADAANIDTQIKQQQKNQNDMKKKIQQYNAIAKEKSKQTQTLLGQLSKLKKDANESQERMNVLEHENSKLQKSVGELNAKISAVNESMKKILDVLKNRLPDIYKFSPEENSLSLILNSSDPHDAVNTAYMLRLFARHDQRMLADLENQALELLESKRILQESQSKIKAQTNELKQKRAEYDNTIKKTDSLLKNVQSEQRKAEAAARELESAQRAVGNKINSLMNQKKTAQTKTAPAKSQPAKSTPTKTQTSSKTSTKAPGRLSWPLNGQVVMQYGSRVHPTFKTKIFNSGIDIKASSGTPVKAAGAGEVLYQGWLRGFGQVVIIDHGGDLSTVYAHLGGASVREGANVKAGTVIGRVGNTGADSEYGLHFEVRKNGSAVNPMNYLR